MNLDERQKLLKELCEIQATGTAPIKLSIGRTDTFGAIRDEIVILECPPVVITELLKNGYFLRVDNGGLYTGVRA